MITGNPIFAREVKAAARDPKVIGLIIAFLAMLSSILIFLWPSSGVFSLASDKSMEIFTIFLMSNLALIILLVPALTSPSLTTERENNSFDLIKTSLMTPGEMLRGKLMACWQALGLPAAPHGADNGVHASASPIEALHVLCFGAIYFPPPC